MEGRRTGKTTRAMLHVALRLFAGERMYIDARDHVSHKLFMRALLDLLDHLDIQCATRSTSRIEILDIAGENITGLILVTKDPTGFHPNIKKITEI